MWHKEVQFTSVCRESARASQHQAQDGAETEPQPVLCRPGGSLQEAAGKTEEKRQEREVVLKKHLQTRRETKSTRTLRPLAA